MCTLVISRRPDHAWPVLVAANRDEMADRPWRPPARHWPDRAQVVAGLDELAGGTWLGLNDQGVVAGVLNRRGSLGPAPGSRSRGELVLAALDHGAAAAAAEALAALDPAAYRSFNLVVADRDAAFWLAGHGPEGPASVEVRPVPDGLSMFTAHDMNDLASPRIRRHLPRFRSAPAPDPDAGDWRAWEELLASRSGPGDGQADDNDEGAMSVTTEFGFGTVSSSLLALPAAANGGRRAVWRFAGGRPGTAPFRDVTLR